MSVSMLVFLDLVCFLLLLALYLSGGGWYDEAIFSSSALLWPLSSNRLMIKEISSLRSSGDEQIRWALQSSALKVAITVVGCCHELAFIVMFVLDGLR